MMATKNTKSPKILFLLKKRRGKAGYTSSPGLNNSAQFVHDMLVDNGIESKLVEVVDNNCIDREVTAFRPSHVIIEALWVVPEKLEVLFKRHPNVIWNIRIHSELPFLANEGMAIDWLFRYLDYTNAHISFNSWETCLNFRQLYSTKKAPYHIRNKIVYLPNYYPINFQTASKVTGPLLNVGCFGAIRPLKNQLIQAVAAIEYAKLTNRKLRYHINSSRIEGKGEAVLTNIRALFAGLSTSQFQLVEHEWMSHEKFKMLIFAMDIGLQLSFSETFNIVTADFVSLGVPVVTSSEIKWVSPLFHANPTSVTDIVQKMCRAEFCKEYLGFVDLNKIKLKKYSLDSTEKWMKYVTK